MGPVFFVLAILGCGEDGGPCRAVRVEPVRYATAAQCQAAMPSALARVDVDYPTISGACRASGSTIASAERPRRRA